MRPFPRYEYLAVTVALVAGLSGVAQKMTDAYYRTNLEDIRRPEKSANKIHDGHAAIPSPARPADASGSGFRFSNAARNSRLNFALHKAGGHPVWQTPLPDHTTPKFVLAGASRVVVEALEGWVLISEKGELLHEGQLGAGEPALDAKAGLLYAVSETGFVGAYALDDGQRRFFLTPFFGSEFRRDFIYRRGRQMIIASVEKPRPSHDKVAADQSVIELQDLGQPLEVAESGRLKSAQRVEYLKRRIALLIVAMQGETIALATRDSLALADPSLKLLRESTGSFSPMWLSLDEAARIHVIVKTEAGLELWVVNAEGDREVRFPIPQGVQPIAPAMIAYDHSIYIIGSSRILALDPSGSLHWERAEPAAIAGAAITSDDRLIVATGRELLVFGAGGERSPLLELDDDRWATPPAAGNDGALYAAGQHRLYRIY